MLADARFVSVIVSALLVMAVLLITGGALDGLSESAASFVGVLVGSVIGFLGLIIAALYNADLNRQQAADEERRRLRSYSILLFSKLRSLATNCGGLATIIKTNGFVTVDNLQTLSHLISTMRDDETSNARLLDLKIQVDYSDVVTGLEAMEGFAAIPIKSCSVVGGVYQTHPAMRDALVDWLLASCEEAISLRKKLSNALGIDDMGPHNLQTFNLRVPVKVDGSPTPSEPKGRQ